MITRRYNIIPGFPGIVFQIHDPGGNWVYLLRVVISNVKLRNWIPFIVIVYDNQLPFIASVFSHNKKSHLDSYCELSAPDRVNLSVNST